VKALMKCSGTGWDKEEASEEVGEDGGEGEEGSDSLDVVLRLRSRASSGSGSDLTLKSYKFAGGEKTGGSGGRYLWWYL